MNVLDVKICVQAKGSILLMCGRETWWGKIHCYSEVFLVGGSVCWEERSLWKIKEGVECPPMRLPQTKSKATSGSLYNMVLLREGNMKSPSITRTKGLSCTLSCAHTLVPDIGG